MPHIVRRYNNPEEYLDGSTTGTRVSAPMKTFEAAQAIRDLLREWGSCYYYNITHNTKCAIITKGDTNVG